MTKLIRTALCKVTMWQVKLVIKNLKKSTNIILILTSFSFLLLYIIRGKMDTKESPSERRWDIPSRPSSSRDDVSRSRAEDFLGRRLQELSSPYKTIGAPLLEGSHGTNMIPQERRQPIAAKWMVPTVNKRKNTRRLERILIPGCAESACKFTRPFWNLLQKR